MYFACELSLRQTSVLFCLIFCAVGCSLNIVTENHESDLDSLQSFRTLYVVSPFSYILGKGVFTQCPGDCQEVSFPTSVSLEISVDGYFQSLSHLINVSLPMGSLGSVFMPWRDTQVYSFCYSAAHWHSPQQILPQLRNMGVLMFEALPILLKSQLDTLWVRHRFILERTPTLLFNLLETLRET